MKERKRERETKRERERKRERGREGERERENERERERERQRKKETEKERKREREKEREREREKERKENGKKFKSFPRSALPNPGGTAFVCHVASRVSIKHDQLEGELTCAIGTHITPPHIKRFDRVVVP